ncbi:MAG: DUF2892 domain-containing protein [Nanohaloarchaea archaeon]|nr:DUF2892 domain-containing protein [Candidatus Nanohaloarchaea archaeon]
MNKNISQKDRAIRIIAGAVLLPSVVLNTPFTLSLTGIAYVAVALLSVDLLVTGAMGISPMYGLLKKKTPAKKKVVAIKKSVRKPAAKKARAPARKKVPAKRKAAPKRKK